MEVTKPLTITHTSVGAGGRKSGQASSIFSLSLCSSGRLATSGLDTTIRIWSTTTTTTTATTTTTITDTPATTELLSILSRHTGAVLAVRWSPLEGGILASGENDLIALTLL